MKKILLSLCVTGLLLTGCQTAREELNKAGKKPMPDAALTKLYSQGSTFSFISSRGRPAIQSFGKDGTIKLNVNDGKFVDEGKWRVKNGKICTAYKKVRDGKEACYELYDMGGGSYKLIDDAGKERVTNYKRTS